jgi:uncharacterized protein involved in exopolysaccharide biosynthesis
MASGKRFQHGSRRARGVSAYFKAAGRRKLVLMAPVLVFAVATAVALTELPKLYESTAVVAQTGKNAQDDLPTRLIELRKQLTSRDVIESLIGNRDQNETIDELSLVQTRITLRASPAREPGVFEVSYRATDPKRAQTMLTGLVDRLIATNRNAGGASDSTVEPLRKRAASISAQLHELEMRDPRLLAASGEMPFASSSQPTRNSQPSPDAMRADQMTIASLKDQQYKFEQELADLERRIALQRQLVEHQEKGSPLRNNPTYAVLIGKRTELQGQRDTLINRQELTDKHPRVLGINDQIAAINRQIDELRRQDAAVASQSPEARELASLEAERHRLTIELEVAGRELARRSTNAAIQLSPKAQPQREATAPKLLAEYVALIRNYQQVANELQNAEARVPRNDSVDVAELRMIEPPSLSEHPVAVNRVLLIAVAATAGLALGAVFAVFAESRRLNSLEDARDVEYYTRLPLLASIPKTITVGERRRRWWRAKLKFAISAAASAVVTVALAKVFVLADIFALITSK